jgi:uncharacterized OsmC-like protein
MATQTTETTVNGIKTDVVHNLAETIEADPLQGKCRFQLINKWVSGGHNNSIVANYVIAGREYYHQRPFQVEADEPVEMAGSDQAPNPTEHLLHALLSCLTSSMVYHAATRGIIIEELESQAEGDIDIRGLMGVSEDIRKGYEKIRVQFKVKTDPKNLERLRDLCEFSPVFDVVRHGTPVEVTIETK